MMSLHSHAMFFKHHHNHNHVGFLYLLFLIIYYLKNINININIYFLFNLGHIIFSTSQHETSDLSKVNEQPEKENPL